MFLRLNVRIDSFFLTTGKSHIRVIFMLLVLQLLHSVSADIQLKLAFWVVSAKCTNKKQDRNGIHEQKCTRKLKTCASIFMGYKSSHPAARVLHLYPRYRGINFGFRNTATDSSTCAYCPLMFGRQTCHIERLVATADMCHTPNNRNKFAQCFDYRTPRSTAHISSWIGESSLGDVAERYVGPLWATRDRRGYWTRRSHLPNRVYDNEDETPRVEPDFTGLRWRMNIERDVKRPTMTMQERGRERGGGGAATCRYRQSKWREQNFIRRHSVMHVFECVRAHVCVCLC